MQRLSVVLYGTLGSYMSPYRDALHEVGAVVVACLPAPRAYGPLCLFLSFFAGGFHYFLCN
jgi:hypothetical protein